MPNKNVKKNRAVLPKSRTGIDGLDEITGGGLPQGRPTLVAGTAGSGKTLLAMEFLVRGATQFGEPGVFMSFEEPAEDLAKNVASLGFDVEKLVAQKRLFIDHVRIERSEIEETGEYDLDGLFVRLAYAIDVVKAKRVVLDTIEALFGELPNPAILRAEVRRLFGWLKSKGVTSLITGERDRPESITRHGLEEFVSDCVILLDHRVQEQVSTRRLRIVKYRGSTHGTNEYPFLIDEKGFSVLPISSLALNHGVTEARISTGIERLDAMMGGKGLYRGSSILVSGTAGAGKTSIAAHMVDAACRRGERVLYFAFEESSAQIIRNMRSIGVDLERWVRRGLLHFNAVRPTFSGLEQHLVRIHQAVVEAGPSLVVLDPVTNLEAVSNYRDVRAMLTRLIDDLKMKGITAVFTSLTGGVGAIEDSEVGISSLIDTWLLLKVVEYSGERNRVLYLLKSRGMAHSNQVREFVLTSDGIQLVDVYTGPEGVLTGSARAALEAREKMQAEERRETVELKQRQLERTRKTLDAQIQALRAEFASQEDDLRRAVEQEENRRAGLSANRADMARRRRADRVARNGRGRQKARVARA